MDPVLAREFRDRWLAVREVEVQERRAASISLRWRQLNSIIRMAAALHLPPRVSDAEDDVVWQRWARLKGAGE